LDLWVLDLWVRYNLWALLVLIHRLILYNLWDQSHLLRH
jgi:hypothetical protein